MTFLALIDGDFLITLAMIIGGWAVFTFVGVAILAHGDSDACDE